MSKLSIKEIYIGMPVTISVGSDAYPYEVIQIPNATTVIVREVQPIGKSDWASGCHTEKYKSMPHGDTKVLTNRGTHGWHVQGGYRSKYYGWSEKVSFGKAVYYRDPSF